MADIEDEGFPPETQKSPEEFAFHEICQLKTLESSEQPNYDIARSNLLVVANKFGLIFVGTPNGIKVFSTRDVLDAGRNKEQGIGFPTATITLRNAPNWLGISTDNLTLSVCCRTGQGPQILFFDIRNILNKTKETKTPFHNLFLSKNPSAYVTSLKWNPSLEFANLLALCLSTGSFHLLAIEKSAREVAIRPDDFGASTVCWSPKGKQMIIGKNDGTLHQLTQKLEVRRSVSVTNVIDRSVKTCDILWISTYHVAAAYVVSDDDSFNQPNLFLANLPSKNEQRDVIWRNYEDPCFGMNEARESRYFFTFIDQWQMFTTLSSNSTEVAVIGKNKDSQIWEIWTLDDSSRAALPVSDFTQDDSSPLGAGIITTAKDRIIMGDEKECGPMPIMAILTNDGVLCLYDMINLMTDYPDILQQEVTLDLAEERVAVDIKGPRTEDAETKTPIPSQKQKLSAKPSVPPTGTPKPGFLASWSKFDVIHPPPFAASTPIVGKLPLFSEGPSIIQQLRPSKSLTKPPLTRESLAKLPAFTKVKHQAHDKTADTVCSEEKTGSNEPVFHPQLKSRISHPDDVSRSSISEQFSQTLIQDTSEKTLTSAVLTTELQPKGTIRQHPPMKSGLAEFAKKPPLTAKKSHFPFSTTEKGAESELKTALEDISNFEMELNQFRCSAQEDDSILKHLGSSGAKTEIIQELKKLNSFSTEIRKTTQELGGEIEDASTSLLALIADAENLNWKHSHMSAGAYRTLLYNRSLDRLQRQKFEALRGLYQYLVSSVRDANAALDAQWEKNYSKKRGGRNRLQIGDWERAYQGLASNMKILHSQEMKVMLLSQQLDRLRLEKTSSRQYYVSPLKSSIADKSSSDLQILADTLLLQRTQDTIDETKPPALTNTGDRSQRQRMSPKKQAQLSQMFVKRKVTPVRSSGGTSSSIIRPYVKNASRTKSPEGTVVSSESDNLSSLVETTSKSSTGNSASPFEEPPSEIQAIAVAEKHQTYPVNASGGKGDAALTAMFIPTQQFRNIEDSPAHFSSPASSSGMSKIIPQGSATLGYGAPKSATADTKRREMPLLSIDNVEAKSNLNNPPQVVNIQNFGQKGPDETPATVKFEPKPEVPPGAVKVVQNVLNFVKAEKQHQNTTEWHLGDLVQPPLRQVTEGSSSFEIKSKLSNNSGDFPNLTTSIPQVKSVLSENVLPVISSSITLPAVALSSAVNVDSGFFKPAVTGETKKGVSKSASMPLVTAPSFLMGSSPVQTPLLTQCKPVPATSSAVSGSLPELFKLGVTPGKEPVRQESSTGPSMPTGNATNESSSKRMPQSSSGFDSPLRSLSNEVPSPSTIPSYTSKGMEQSLSGFDSPLTSVPNEVPSLSTTPSCTAGPSTFVSTTAQITTTVYTPNEPKSESPYSTIPPVEPTLTQHQSAFVSSLSISSTSVKGGEAVLSTTTGPIDPAETETSALGSIVSTTAASSASFSFMENSKGVIPPPPATTTKKVSSASSPVGSVTFSDNGVQTGVFGAFASTKPAFGESSMLATAPALSSAAPQTTSSSVFGSSSNVFGAKSSGSIFGTLSSESKPASSPFQTPPVFGQTADKPTFGSISAFGSDGTGSAKSVFGSGFGTMQPTSGSGGFSSFTGASGDKTPSGFGGFGFSGLGGTPSAEAANKNPFQISQTPQGDENAPSSLFGSAGAKSFGQTNAFGHGFGSSGFSATSAGVGSQGFGGFNKPQQSAFGSVPSFGSSAAFGSPALFGSSSNRTFGSGFGANLQSTETFGQAPPPDGGFASFASNDAAPGFANIAGGSGFGASSQVPFGSSPFGAQNQKSPSFSGWR